MTGKQKEQFCLLAAALLSPPDGALVSDLKQGELRAQLDALVRALHADRQILTPFLKGTDEPEFLLHLKREYLRLFDQHEGERISLVESTYKPWTADQTCAMAFATSRGLLMGDPALHMFKLYEDAAIAIPDEFRSQPDHLVLELEFLGLLYRSGSQGQLLQFIQDHLDWIPDLKTELEKAGPDDFYRNSIQLIHLFMQHEQKVRNGEAHG